MSPNKTLKSWGISSILNCLIKVPHLSFLLSSNVTWTVLSNVPFFNVLSLKILNLLPSHPVLFWVNNKGNPSSKKINNEETNKIGEANIKKNIDSILSKAILINKFIPWNRETSYFLNSNFPFNNSCEFKLDVVSKSTIKISTEYLIIFSINKSGLVFFDWSIHIWPSSWYSSIDLISSVFLKIGTLISFLSSFWGMAS